MLAIFLFSVYQEWQLFYAFEFAVWTVLPNRLLRTVLHRTIFRPFHKSADRMALQTLPTLINGACTNNIFPTVSSMEYSSEGSTLAHEIMAKLGADFYPCSWTINWTRTLVKYNWTLQIPSSVEISSRSNVRSLALTLPVLLIIPLMVMLLFCSCWFVPWARLREVDVLLGCLLPSFEITAEVDPHFSPHFLCLAVFTISTS